MVLAPNETQAWDLSQPRLSLRIKSNLVTGADCVRLMRRAGPLTLTKRAIYAAVQQKKWDGCRPRVCVYPSGQCERERVIKDWRQIKQRWHSHHGRRRQREARQDAQQHQRGNPPDLEDLHPYKENKRTQGSASRKTM